MSDSIKATVFDLFGTLVPPFSFSRHEQAMKDMAALLGVQRETFRTIWVRSYESRVVGRYRSTLENLQDALRQLGIKGQDDQMTGAVERFRVFTEESLTCTDCTLAVLDFLRGHKIKIGVVSDCSAEVAKLWPTTKLSKKVDAVVLSCLVGQAKPGPRLYSEVCASLSVQPDECLYIGDGSSHELTGARRAGMTSILLHSQTTDTYDVQRYDVDHWKGKSIESIEALYELFEVDQRESHRGETTETQ